MYVFDLYGTLLDFRSADAADALTLLRARGAVP